MSFAYIFPGITSVAGMKADVHDIFLHWLPKHLHEISHCLSHEVLQGIAQTTYSRLSGTDIQIVGYLVSCAVFDHYVSRRGNAAYIGCYSVGIFAASYASRLIPLVTGVQLIGELNRIIAAAFAAEDQFAMATVIGLERECLTSIVNRFEQVDIVNQNAATSLVLSGSKMNVDALRDEAYAAGALMFKVLPIDRPYHSSLLLGCLPQWKSVLAQVVFDQPRIPIVSPTTLNILADSQACVEELQNNFCSAFFWLEVLQRFWDMGIHELYECGASRDLAKIGKYSGLAHRYP